jgi:hypothetical protein
MYKHALLMTLLIHAVCQITMSDSMMNVKHVLLITLLIYAVSQITTSDLMMNVHTYASDNITITMLYVRSLCLIQR